MKADSAGGSADRREHFHAVRIVSSSQKKNRDADRPGLIFLKLRTSTRRSHAHVLHGVAPIGEAGAAAVRAHLDIDNLAGGQADDGHYALGLEAFGVLRRVDAHPPARQ